MVNKNRLIKIFLASILSLLLLNGCTQKILVSELSPHENIWWTNDQDIEYGGALTINTVF